MITEIQEQLFLKALLRIHANGTRSCTLSEIKNAAQEKVDKEIDIEYLKKIRNHLVNKGFVEKIGAGGYFHILTTNGEHATGVYR